MYVYVDCSICKLHVHVHSNVQGLVNGDQQLDHDAMRTYIVLYKHVAWSVISLFIFAFCFLLSLPPPSTPPPSTPSSFHPSSFHPSFIPYLPSCICHAWFVLQPTLCVCVCVSACHLRVHVPFNCTHWQRCTLLSLHRHQRAVARPLQWGLPAIPPPSVHLEHPHPLDPATWYM